MPGSNSRGVRIVRSTNSLNGALRLRNSTFSGSWSGKPDVCVSNCLTVTRERAPALNSGMKRLTGSASFNSPRSASSIAPAAVIGLVIEASKKIASTVEALP